MKWFHEKDLRGLYLYFFTKIPSITYQIRQIWYRSLLSFSILYRYVWYCRRIWLLIWWFMMFWVIRTKCICAHISSIFAKTRTPNKTKTFYEVTFKKFNRLSFPNIFQYLLELSWVMGDDIGSGSVTGCRLWSLRDHRRHTQLHWAALRRKSKQTEPEPMSSPINYPA